MRRSLGTHRNGWLYSLMIVALTIWSYDVFGFASRLQ